MSGGAPPRTGLLSPGESRTAADEIRQLRRARGLTQAEFAALLYRSTGWVSKREVGGALLTRGEVMHACAVLRAGEAPDEPPPEAVAGQVRSFRDIPVSCPCDWAMTFWKQRPSGWELARPWPGCVHHGKRSGGPEGE